MWTELETGHWRFENNLGISVVISPRDSDAEEWRYRVADEKHTARPDAHLEGVKAFAITRLEAKIQAFLETL